MITLKQLVEATTWLQPQDHMKVVLWNRSHVYEEDEFQDIDLTIRNFAKYANYYVSDIDIEFESKDNDSESFLGCMIWKD